jgi:gas vesicle protein
VLTIVTHPNSQAHPYQQPDMARRNDRMEFPGYGAPQAGMAPQQQQPQHHPTPVQPPMNVPQPSPNAAQSQQQQTPTQTPAQPARQRKRPAPSSNPVAAAPPAPVTPAQAQAAVAGPPAAQPVGTAVGTPAQPQPAVDDSAAVPAPPPAKKNRTNTPWTPQEELRLKQMRDAGNSWAEIAKTFPTRTEGSVKKHWYKDMHYAEFAEDESQALMSAIKDYENSKWKVIGQKVGKPAKACEQYAKEHFPELFGNAKGR